MKKTKKKTSPFVTRLWRHQPVNQVIIDQPFDSIDPKTFPNLGHKKCNGDEGCVVLSRKIKRCGVYCRRLHPDQPRRYPIKFIELKPCQKGKKTLVLWRGGADSFDDLKAILGLLGVTGAVVGRVKHSQVEMFANIHHGDLQRVKDGVRSLLGCGWGLHVLQETTPGTLHKVKAAKTYLEGRLIRTEICRVIPERKCPEVELVIYDIPETLKFGYIAKLEVVVRAQDGKPFTNNEFKKLEKIIAGFLVVLIAEINVPTHGLVKRQNGQAYPYKRVTGSHFGKRSPEAFWYAVELGERESLCQRDAVEKHLYTALSFLACCPVIRQSKSRMLAKYGTPLWGLGRSKDVIRRPITQEVNRVMHAIAHPCAA